MYHTLALTLVPGIGPVNAKSLISYCGSAEKIFKTSKKKLTAIPGIGDGTATAIVSHDIFGRVDEEMQFIEKKKITCLTYWDENYPQRLKNCIDGPVLLFYKGNTDLNADKIIGIVGTRNATEYGRNICEEIIDGLKEYNILMISGLAYGIDIAAHKACVKKNVPTVGVVGHGLDRIYPPIHKETAKKMIDNGGILTEFISKTQPDRQNFPKRNRIVAGMIDALIVVETTEDGGAIITAAIANTYNRDVLAIPGDIKSKYSRGCHYLIKTNRAQLIENADDVLSVMNWKEKEIKPKKQRELFIEFSPEERLIYDVLKENNELAIDELSSKIPLSPSLLASNLLSLEFQNVIAVLPGKRYKLN
ncbi:MAG: DNA-protecting protein DprA [Fimbriimonadaceae bacterium]|nr:DNA-protecting protein DprA [Chitinophagales bacterium]